MDAVLKLTAMSALRGLRARQAEFEADRRDWYTSGDGRAPHWVDEVSDDGTEVRRTNMGGQGHQFPVACVHGASAWTDYDNICGPCEDGYTLHQLALAHAHQVAAEYRKRAEVFDTLRAHKHELLDTTMKDLGSWAWTPMEPAFEEFGHHNFARMRRMAGFRAANNPPAPEPVTDEAREAQATYDDRWN